MICVKKVLRQGFFAICACLSGVFYEKLKNKNYNFNSTIKAATAIEIKVKPEEIFKNQDNLKDIDFLNKNEDKIFFIAKHGFPSYDNIKNYNNFIISYDKRNRNANWVLEHLSSDNLYKKKIFSKSNLKFFQDESIHEFFRTSNEDFQNSGYDRGHLAAAANHNNDLENLKQTFVLTNISPQVGIGFNRHIWNELEKYVRFRAKYTKNTWVCTGPLYLPRNINGRNFVIYEVIGKKNVAVPTHFFKILLIENLDNTLELESYVIQNTKFDKLIPLKSFQTSIDFIEKASGLLIFDKIPKHRFKSINESNIYLEKFEFKK